MCIYETKFKREEESAMNIDNLGRSVAYHRKRMNLTQEKLAEHLDVSTHYIYEIEKCGKTPSFPYDD